MLTVDSLTVRYGRVVAVRDVSLEIGEGETVGLVGPNGAGKSTTLAAVMGLRSPAAGKISFDGESLVGQVPEAIVQAGLALVPEGRRIFGTLTVAENLELGRTLHRRSGASAALLDDVLDRFPVLRRYTSRPAGTLSGGEQQQLAIARALLCQPRLLLLDEPSLGLAPLVTDEVFAILAELKRDGVTILLVEQNAARTIAFADRTYVLRSGAVALAGTRAELAERTDVSELYLGF